ncbi:serine hydrolase domain-containing protein [Stenotrophomonas sp. ZAC14A_NAIMI4_1]|uniref:serine hydrolase domain-containing protein n=1 Tax=Stenotrophomonas sp. ZAC14A_NAIMI4_1 TaxID=2072412 RepID=UPI000D54204C|nr:serine hydrolase domain-containing protein [Stenotrophomonas sp. ZAC14A_NAIMI4_1]AWH46475.1 serine hydrolase [Stenotrophomonas sp. ZAC14A_NAIMI4_1]
MSRLAALLLLPTLLLSSAINAAPAAPQGMRAERLDAFLSQMEDSNAGIGSVSIFRNGEEVYARRFGQKQLAGVSYNADTKYQIASVTKMVTAILAFKLIEEGRLSLDDTLSQWFPDLPSAQAITVGNLLGHTSGLGNFAIKDGTVWVVDKVSEPAILDEIRTQGISFAPGQGTAYSNSAYLLLRMILEKVSGRSYAEMVAQDIAAPLGLRNFVSAGVPQPDTFLSYTYAGKWTPIKDIDYANVVGVGDIAGTPHDLNLLITGLFQQRLLRSMSLQQMIPATGEGWGRGLAAFPYGQRRFLGHGGDVLGSHSRVIYNPQDGTAIAYSTNGERIPTNDVLATLVGIVYGENVTFPTVPNP